METAVKTKMKAKIKMKMILSVLWVVLLSSFVQPYVVLAQSTAADSSEQASNIEVQGVDPLLIRGIYHLIVDSDLNQAASYFQALLVKQPENPEANYFVGRVLYEQVQRGMAPRSLLAQAESYLRIAVQRGLVFDRLHNDFLSGIPEGALQNSGFIPQSTTLDSQSDVPPVYLTLPVESRLTVDVMQPDPIGYTRTFTVSAGETIRLESGQRYKLHSRRTTNWKRWTLPGIVAGVVVGLVAVR